MHTEWFIVKPWPCSIILYTVCTISSNLHSNNDLSILLFPMIFMYMQATRGLASEITQSGVKLSDYLENEQQDKGERAKALRFLDAAGTSNENSREHGE